MEPDFPATLAAHGLDLAPTALSTLQMNVTRLCNQACVHCHVDASPRRREMMTDVVLDRCLEVLRGHPGIDTVDLTGGAPELHPRFRSFVAAVRRLGRRVVVRHNLTVTLDPHPLTGESLEDLPDFFAGKGVEVVSSLPCYTEATTDRQRGDGVFQKSIASLRRLNERGYGRELPLSLVYNPAGAFLPPPQETLEVDYRRALRERFGIEFTRLLVLTNMPIHRFKAQLRRTGAYEAYLETLARAFNPAAAEGVMCRSLVSVGPDGKLYDCDFNQMLGLASGPPGAPLTIFDFDGPALLARRLRFGVHCFGCAAGAGSSCGGATVPQKS